MTSHEYCTPDMIRRHEEMMITNQKTIELFMERYNNDRHECAERYHNDREEARAFRREIMNRLESIELFLSEFKPNYKRVLAFTGIVILGAISLIFKMIWDHITK
jgi:hypothetical protein